MTTHLKGSIQGPHGLVLADSTDGVRSVATFICTCGTAFQAELRLVRRGSVKSCGCHVARPPRTAAWLRRTVHDINVRAWNRSGRHPSYAEVGVDPRWDRLLAENCHAAQDRFVEWALAQEGWDAPTSSIARHDLAGPYAPDNCLFLPLSTNARRAEAIRRAIRETPRE